MIKKCLAATIVLLMFSISAGFAEMQHSRLEMDYGTSHNLQKFNQILNPDAEKNLETVEGIDGKAADRIMGKYTDSFGKKSESPAMSLTTGKKGKGK